MFRLRRPRFPLQTARRVVAALLACAALALALRPAGATPPADPATAEVVVSATDLPPGTVLAAGDLAVARLPDAVAPSGAVADPASLLGRELAGGVRAGEPLTDVRLVGTGLTALLAPGEVAAPVRLADLAVAGLVRAGDRVDVLATAPDAAAAEVVAAGALVLAVPPEVSSSGSGPVSGLLLLAVDAATAAHLAAAATTATLTVSLPRRAAAELPGPAGRDVGG